VEENLGKTGLWGKRGQIKSGTATARTEFVQAERDAGFPPTSGSSSVAPPPPSPTKMRPNTELACILADEAILLGSRVGIHSCSFECSTGLSHQSPSQAESSASPDSSASIISVDE
jgi:hypothetical protein